MFGVAAPIPVTFITAALRNNNRQVRRHRPPWAGNPNSPRQTCAVGSGARRTTCATTLSSWSNPKGLLGTGTIRSDTSRSTDVGDEDAPLMTITGIPRVLGSSMCAPRTSQLRSSWQNGSSSSTNSNELPNWRAAGSVCGHRLQWRWVVRPARYRRHAGAGQPGVIRQRSRRSGRLCCPPPPRPAVRLRGSIPELPQE
jgi:hypothetical protein